jgi:hypothetical protein
MPIMRKLKPRKNTRRKMAGAFGLTVVAVTASAIFAAPASAGTNCSAGYHCVFYSDLDGAKHSYFGSDSNFSNDTFNEYGVSGSGYGETVNDNVWAASNSSTGGYESHYYLNANYDHFLFCVNPGSEVNTVSVSERDQASSLLLRGTTSIHCY